MGWLFWLPWNTTSVTMPSAARSRRRVSGSWCPAVYWLRHGELRSSSEASRST